MCPSSLADAAIFSIVLLTTFITPAPPEKPALVHAAFRSLRRRASWCVPAQRLARSPCMKRRCLGLRLARSPQVQTSDGASLLRDLQVPLALVRIAKSSRVRLNRCSESHRVLPTGRHSKGSKRRSWGVANAQGSAQQDCRCLLGQLRILPVDLEDS